jgi:hypothetical protein
MGILDAGRLGVESIKRMDTHLSMSVRALLSKEAYEVKYMTATDLVSN